MAEKKKAESTEEPKPKQEPQSDVPQGKDIDQRMADLLADHKRMGAR